METIRLNTDNASNIVRSHFGVSGITKSEVHFHRSGKVSSIELNGTVTRSGMPYFNYLCCMVMEAKQEMAQ